MLPESSHSANGRGWARFRRGLVSIAYGGAVSAVLPPLREKPTLIEAHRGF